jgi:hypothetical protein
MVPMSFTPLNSDAAPQSIRDFVRQRLKAKGQMLTGMEERQKTRTFVPAHIRDRPALARDSDRGRLGAPRTQVRSDHGAYYSHWIKARRGRLEEPVRELWK